MSTYFGTTNRAGGAGGHRCGASFRHSSASVDKALVEEPEPYLRGRAGLAAAQAAHEGERCGRQRRSCFPGDDGSFDPGVVALALCTVPDQGGALTELHRVIPPGGGLRFYEQVVAQSSRVAFSESPMQRSGLE